jgi:hypothetical protein
MYAAKLELALGRLAQIIFPFAQEVDNTLALGLYKLPYKMYSRDRIRLFLKGNDRSFTAR